MSDFQAVYEKLIVHGNKGLIAKGGTCSCRESSFDNFKGYFGFWKANKEMKKTYQIVNNILSPLWKLSKYSMNFKF